MGASNNNTGWDYYNNERQRLSKYVDSGYADAGDRQNALNSLNAIETYMGVAKTGAPTATAASVAPAVSPMANYQYRKASDYSKYGAPAGQPTAQPSAAVRSNPLNSVNNISSQPSSLTAQSILSRLGYSRPVGMNQARPQGSYMPVMGASNYPQTQPPAYASGGAVNGSGGGQDDDRMVDAIVGDFVLPADVVAHLGDGNNAEGQRRIADLETKYKGYATGGRVNPLRKTKIMISAGERKIPHNVVSALGDGSNAKGTKKLYELIKKVRQHKGMANQLPPPAKNPLAYMQG